MLSLSPLLIVTSVFESVIDVADTTTVTSQVAFLPEPVVAVIVALPGLTALTVPLSFTTQTEVSELVHVTVSLESVGNSSAVSVSLSPYSILVSVLLSVIESAGELTVTLQLPFVPLVAVAVITALPFPKPVMLPSSSTVHISLLLDDHEIVSVVNSGSTIAFNLSISPILILTSSFSKLMLFAGASTVTVQVSITPLAAAAVITVLPGFNAVTRPFSSTVAASSLLELQLTVSVQSSGASTVVSCFVSPE